MTRLLALVLLLAAGAPAVADSVYCVERDPDVVAGIHLHDGIRRCVPGP